MAKRGLIFRMVPEGHEALLRRTIGCARLVKNKALQARNEKYKHEKKSLGLKAMNRLLTTWKKEPELAFLNEVSSVPLQQALHHLKAAFKNFFEKRAGYPKFQKKGSGGTAEFTRSGFKWDPIAHTITLAKTRTPLNICWTQRLPKGVTPSTVTVRLAPDGNWFVSIRINDPRIQPLPKLDNAVGIDVGVRTLATLSTGKKFKNRRQGERSAPKRAKLARRLDKKQKGSKNWEKARQKLAKCDATTANRRKDTLHKVSTRIVRKTQVIVAETLNVKGMAKREGHNGRVIHDAGIAELLRMIAYKSEWYGRTFLKIDRWEPSSKRCFCCRFVLDKLDRNAKQWTCPACGVEHDRDVNAARNILAAGLAVTACGPDVRQMILRGLLQLGLKQEDFPVTERIPDL